MTSEWKPSEVTPGPCHPHATDGDDSDPARLRLDVRTESRTLLLEVTVVTAVSATSARANLYRLIDQVNQDSEPLTITGQRGNAVLIGEDDWRAIQESLFLAGLPGFTESVRQARAEGIEAGSDTVEW